ncbi:Uncharacterized CRM domain-containing protein At3g25440, chloroplastic [Linum perenne]
MISNLESLQKLLLKKAVFVDEGTYAKASLTSEQARIIKFTSNIRGICPANLRRAPLVCFGLLRQGFSSFSRQCSVSRPSTFTTSAFPNARGIQRSFLPVPCAYFTWLRRINKFSSPALLCRQFTYTTRQMSSRSVQLKTYGDVIKFSVDKKMKEGSSPMGEKKSKKNKMSKRAKVNELRFYRLKAKKKINSPNPEVRIRYKLEKAKRKEAWLIEKLMKFDLPKGQPEAYDPEIVTEEEKHYLKRTGEKKKNFVIVGRRGVFGGVVLNMHLHWKKHETVKVICKPCQPGQIHEYADELSRLSKGIVIDIKPNNSIIFYRGKNYVQPPVLSPPNTLSKAKALEKYKFQQSLDHTSQFIEKLEKELEEYLEHVARYRRVKDEVQGCKMPDRDDNQITKNMT